MQRLRAAGRLSQAELAHELDVGGRLEAVGDPREVIGVKGRQLSLVVGQRLVDRAEPLAGRHRVDLAFRLHVLPEGDDVAAVPVRAGIEQAGRRHDRRSGASGVGRDRQLADHVLLGRAFRVGPAARDAGDERQRPEMDEHVPGVAEDARVVAAQPMLRRHLDRRSDRALAHPNPYVPGKRSARRRTSSAVGSPTTLR